MARSPRIKMQNTDSNEGFGQTEPEGWKIVVVIGLESIIMGFAPRSSVENVILRICWQLEHTHGLIQ